MKIKPKVCILAAGTGSRLGSVSESLGKALLPIANSTALSFIINKFSKEFEIIIAVGYKSELIKEYCSAAHYDRKITFVDVDNYDQPGSGPGYSLSLCRPHLNTSFYLTTVDCLVDEVPDLDCDWIGTYYTDNPSLYSTADVDSFGNIKAFMNKSSNGFNNAFIGLAFVKSSDIFWAQIDKYKNSENEVEFVAAWYETNLYPQLKAVDVKWSDTGSISGYTNTLNKYGHSNLGMSKVISEHTFHENNRIIKITLDKDKNLKRYLRSTELKALIPLVTYYADYTLAYEYVSGEEMYCFNYPLMMVELLNYLKHDLWKFRFIFDFPKYCYEFYHDKTYQRYNKINFIDDNNCVINSLECDPILSILNKINFNRLSYGQACVFHGDLQFQNIIVTKNKFILIDWREEFINNSKTGDQYYDLGKLYACLLFDYSKISHYSEDMNIKQNEYSFNIFLSEPLNKAKELFESWVKDHGLDLDRIKIIAALIWLNMSPLHKYPDNILLFLMSKYQLNLLMKQKNSYIQ